VVESGGGSVETRVGESEKKAKPPFKGTSRFRRKVRRLSFRRCERREV